MMANVLETPNLSHFSSKDYDSIYEPAEDSFLFLDALEQDLSILKELNPSICLEVGCGSGVVTTSLAKYFGSSCHFIASDINPLACKATLKTSTINGSRVEVVRADLASELRKDGIIDLLLFNPPYVVTPSDEVLASSPDSNMLHRAWAGGKRGREVTDRLLPHVKSVLSERALFYLVVIDENEPDEIASIMNEHGFKSCIVRTRKVRGEHLSVMRFSRGLF